MYKDNSVGNVAETARDCGTMARLCDLSMPFQLCASPLRGEVRRSPEPSVRPSAAARRERKAANLYDVLIRGQRWIVKRRRSYAFSHRGAHFCLTGGWGRGRDLTWQPAVNHQSPAAKATKSDSCGHTEAQVKEHIPEPGIFLGTSQLAYRR